MKPIDGDKSEQLQQVIDILKRSRYMILTCIDEEERLIAIRKGIPEHELPKAMRYFAEVLEEMQETEQAAAARAAAVHVFEETPPAQKSLCPSCDAQVILATPLPTPEKMSEPNVRPHCVCTCGAFLVPSYEAGALALRMMTIEEIGDLPDGVRNKMLSIRRDIAAEIARRRRNTAS